MKVTSLRYLDAKSHHLSLGASPPVAPYHICLPPELLQLVIEPILVLNLVRARSSWLGLGTKPPADQSPNRHCIV